METHRLAKYEIHEKLGEGATAEVYHARDTVLGRDVALKVLKPALVPDPSAFARFVQEAQAAAKLFHNHIATVLDMGDADGRYFIAMRYVPGKSLDKILIDDGPLPWDDTLRMVKQISEALDFAHGEGFLHRDVKPSNILCDNKGDFWLTDFGLTRAMISTGLTSHTGAVLGTPSYIAPEVWQGEPAAQATDQYSLACVVYEALTGETLYGGVTPQEIITKHLIKEPKFSVQFEGSEPEDVVAIFKKALSREVSQRYESMSIFAQELLEVKRMQRSKPEIEPKHMIKEQQPEAVLREQVIEIAATEKKEERLQQEIKRGTRDKLGDGTQYRTFRRMVTMGLGVSILAIIAGMAVLGGIIVGAKLLIDSNNSSSTSATQTDVVVNEGAAESSLIPTPRANGNLIFEDDFETEHLGLGLLFGAGTTINQYDDLPLDDLVFYAYDDLLLRDFNLEIECQLGLDEQSSSGNCGIFFRGNEYENDWGLSDSYLLLIHPKDNWITFSAKVDSKWVFHEIYTLPPGLIASTNHIRLEAVNDQFNVFVNGEFIFSQEENHISSPGLIGLSLVPLNPADWIAYFDNLKIYSAR